MARFATLRLGKDSVNVIEQINAASRDALPLAFSISCRQVPEAIEQGVYVLIWLGSDNDKGQSTEWKQGFRALGRIFDKSGGPGWNDEWTIEFEVGVILPESINKMDLLREEPTAYYWMSGMPVFGIQDYSNQTVRPVDPEKPQQDLRALFYATEAVAPGFYNDVRRTYPDLNNLLQYTPPSPKVGASGSSYRISAGDDSAEEVHDESSLHAGLPLDWVLSLSSKPFLIVSGSSGTGKTRTGLDIARALDYALPSEYAASRTKPANDLAFIPVGADWTDATPLLGYRNPFSMERQVTRPDTNDVITLTESYEPTPVLLLLLRAIKYPDQPHFLILDEMNLSHVERYFFPFLSVMEASRGLDAQQKMTILDHRSVFLLWATLEASGSHPLEKEVAFSLWRRGEGLTLPPNVFVIGTVNVDETTYMFSPKVLDRAHVMEVQPPRPGEYWNKVSDRRQWLLPRDEAMTMLKDAIQKFKGGFWEREHPADILADVAREKGLGAEDYNAIATAIDKVIRNLDLLLSPVGFGFAYRSVNELAAYMATFLSLGQPDGYGGWQAALDRAVLQKILPKIHGNRRQLGQSLKAVQAFLEGQPGAKYSYGSLTFEVSEGEGLGFALTSSAGKVQRMAQLLEATGYTTFVE